MADEAKTAGVPEQGDNNTVQEQNQTAKEPAKTFTQAELDKIIGERLAREHKNVPSDEELKAYREWQDSQKTTSQKAADELTTALSPHNGIVWTNSAKM